MASRERKGGGDFVLESRHLVGLFLLLVVIFGVVFTLGYLLGRSQYDSQLRAAVGPPAGIDSQAPSSASKGKRQPEPEDTQAPKASSDWDFFHSADSSRNEEHLQQSPKPVSVSAQAASPQKQAPAPSKATKAAKAAPAASGGVGSLIPKGTVMLQVAAVLRQDDALALAQSLQQKKFPAFVITPTTDKYYRVQVGPYSDNQAATKARTDLEADGFKSIIKR